MPKYLFRLDDINPEMNQENFDYCISLCAKYKHKPILGVIPDNKDNNLKNGTIDPFFWEKISNLIHRNRIIISQHGLNHQYSSSSKALLRKYIISSDTEFAGFDYSIQYNKIKNGKLILKKHNLETDIFMPPNHSFDRITLRVLFDLNFKYITDGIGLYPYRKNGITFIPQLSGKPRKIPFGMTTICLHTNTMTRKDFVLLEDFLRNTMTFDFYEINNFNKFIIGPIINILVRIGFYFIKLVLKIMRYIK